MRRLRVGVSCARYVSLLHSVSRELTFWVSYERTSKTQTQEITSSCMSRSSLLLLSATPPFSIFSSNGLLRQMSVSVSTSRYFFNLIFGGRDFFAGKFSFVLESEDLWQEEGEIRQFADWSWSKYDCGEFQWEEPSRLSTASDPSFCLNFSLWVFSDEKEKWNYRKSSLSIERFSSISFKGVSRGGTFGALKTEFSGEVSCEIISFISRAASVAALKKRRSSTEMSKVGGGYKTS